MSEQQYDLEKSGSILGWKFLMTIPPNTLNELTKQIYEIQAAKDKAAEFVKTDEEGRVLFETLREGLDNLRAKAKPEDWPKGMILLTAWMVRDLVADVE